MNQSLLLKLNYFVNTSCSSKIKLTSRQGRRGTRRKEHWGWGWRRGSTRLSRSWLGIIKKCIPKVEIVVLTLWLINYLPFWNCIYLTIGKTYKGWIAGAFTCRSERELSKDSSWNSGRGRSSDSGVMTKNTLITMVMMIITVVKLMNGPWCQVPRMFWMIILSVT